MSVNPANQPSAKRYLEAESGFVETFLKQVEQRPEAKAIKIYGKNIEITYAELLKIIERYRATFVRLGVEENDCVLVLQHAGIEFIATLYALVSLGVIFVPVNPRLTDFELTPILEDAKPVGVVIAGDAARPVLAKAKSVRFVLCTEAPSSAVSPLVHVELLDDLPEERSELLEVKGNPIVACHFTYKGLGYPLGALHTYKALAWSHAATAKRFPEVGLGSQLLLLPLYPIFGFHLCLLSLSLGGTLVIANQFDPSKVIKLLAQHQIRFTAVVPLMVQNLLQHLGESIQKNKRILSGLHPRLEVISGGSVLNPQIASALQQLTGIELHQVYGGSEPLIVTMTNQQTFRRGTLGTIDAQDLKVTITDGQGGEIAPAKIGEVTVSSPGLMQGFINRPRETASFLHDGSFFSGDLGYFDKDGFLHFSGRALPITKIASQMVDLTEVENVLKSHPDVADALVTARPNPRFGNHLSASVIPRRFAALNHEGLLVFCREKLSGFKMPRTLSIYRRRLVALSPQPSQPCANAPLESRP